MSTPTYLLSFDMDAPEDQVRAFRSEWDRLGVTVVPFPQPDPIRPAETDTEPVPWGDRHHMLLSSGDLYVDGVRWIKSPATTVESPAWAWLDRPLVVAWYAVALVVAAALGCVLAMLGVRRVVG